MAEYIASPHASTSPFAPVVVALVAATTKTVLQIATPAGSDIRINGWGVSFDGVSGTGIPVICQLIVGGVAATVTALTPDLWDQGYPASSCVGGVNLTGYNASVEGTITTPQVLDQQHVHPQAGYGIFWPEAHRPRVTISQFLRIRCTAPAGVNVLPWVMWQE
jgi:hypothetical protein